MPTHVQKMSESVAEFQRQIHERFKDMGAEETEIFFAKDSAAGKQLTIDHLQDQVDTLRSHVENLKALVIGLIARVDIMEGPIELDPQKIRADGKVQESEPTIRVFRPGDILRQNVPLPGTMRPNHECTPHE